VTVTAEDEAGNTSTIEFTFNIQRDLSGVGGADDGSDTSDEAELPATGQTQNILSSIVGYMSVAIGALLVAWNKKRFRRKLKFKNFNYK